MRLKFLLPLIALAALPVQAKLPFLRRAQAMGFIEIRSCASCHMSENPQGGPWTARGNWLRAEKERRHAKDVDVAWLREYPGPKK